VRLDLLGNPSSGGNCYLLSTDSDTLMLDGGLAWSQERAIGVDFTVPHFTEDQVANLSTIAITHPHEDHIGALPYLLRSLPALGHTAPHIVAGPITAAIIRARLDEDRIDASVQTLAPYEYGRTRDFRFQMIPVPHSASESMALRIEVDGRRVFYSGDLRGSDETGYGRLPTRALTEAAPVDVLLLEAVRADVDEQDPTLADLKEGLLSALQRLHGRRIIVSAFASNLTRLQIVIELAQVTGRHVYLLGRSMRNAVEMAQEFQRMPKESWSLGPPPKDAPDSRILILVAGAQGEPDAGLSRLIRGHYPVQARRGDGLIMSSTPIPGNEEAFWSLVELAMQKGVEVITYRDYLVHLSGHSTATELQRIMRMLRPRWIVPFHGDYYRHAVLRELGRKAGIRGESFVSASNGDRVRFNGTPAVEHVNWTVDAYQLGKGRQRSAVLLTADVLEERKALLESGVVVIRKSGRRPVLSCIDCPPEIEEWVARAGTTKRPRAGELRRRLESAFDAAPAVIEIG
jgi:ribonuclease J